ncbi:nucleotide-diphospho-sugar transferase [Aspergillus welwitschiae]|uniref:Nucleotide-diphospho-sugar transferase n=1 Tax=Aspergillus welwitschiae TaxID=1341132 RepID=A0A3F3PXH5_9EURO|nr:nucleotide-diphospho-sugar transferase [Aspergillus welwitschiae]RDH31472.1 nucleotide-diphospho-sugar transferase [Aspergillus welwitschiae]
MDLSLSFWLMLGWHLVRRVLRLYGYMRMKPIPVPENPQMRSDCVSVIIPTIGAPVELIPRLHAMLDNHPKEIIIVTTAALIGELKEVLQKFVPKEQMRKIQVLDILLPNKRNQLARGIQVATGEIIVLADDDVYWSKDLLRQVLGVLELEPKVGGVTTLIAAHGLDARDPESITVWEALESRRMSMRNIDIAASSWLDGSQTVLTGRTAAYRARILKDPEYLSAFTNEHWLGRYRMHCGDDQFATRWLLNHGWEGRIQTGATIHSEALCDSRHIKQTLRWARNGKISSAKRIFSKRMWKEYPWLSLLTAQTVVAMIIQTWRLSFLVYIFSDPWLLIERLFRPRITFLLGFYIPVFLEHIAYGMAHRWYLRHLGAQIVKDFFQHYFVTFYTTVTLHANQWGSRDVD